MRNVYLGKRKSLALAVMLTSATSLPAIAQNAESETCLLYTSPSPRD